MKLNKIEQALDSEIEKWLSADEFSIESIASTQTEYLPFLTTQLAWTLSQSRDWESQQVSALIKLVDLLNREKSKAKKIRSHFWIDLLAFISMQNPALAELGNSSHIDQLIQSLQAPQVNKANINPFIFLIQRIDSIYPQHQATSKKESAENYNRLYENYNLIISRSTSDIFDAHLLFYLLAWALKQYFVLEISLSRPILVTLLRRVSDLKLSDLLELQSTFESISELSIGVAEFRSALQIIKDLRSTQEEANDVQKMRDNIVKKLAETQAAEIDDFIYKELNQFIGDQQKNNKSLALLDAYLHDFQDNQISYSRVKNAKEVNKIDWFTINIGRNGYYQPFNNKGSNKKNVFDNYKNYAVKAEQFWDKQPPESMFIRKGHTEKFETLWISEGEILLYGLIDDLINRPESFCLSASLGLDFDSVSPEKKVTQDTTILTHKLNSLLDACERIILPMRTVNKSKLNLKTQKLRYLSWQIYSVFLDLNSNQEPFQRLENMCQQILTSGWKLTEEAPDFCTPAQLDWLDKLDSAGFRELCPYPAFVYEKLIRKNNLLPMYSFLLPLSYERHPAFTELRYIPAAFLTGVYSLKPLIFHGKRDFLPFVSALWKYDAIAISQIARYLIDYELLQIRRTEAAQTSLVQHFGLHNSSVLKHLFEKYRVLGRLDPENESREIKAAHSPQDICSEDLMYYLQYAATGKIAQEPEDAHKLLGLMINSWKKLLAKSDQLSDKAKLNDTARRYFTLLKLMTHDASESTEEGGGLSFAQLVISLWLVNKEYLFKVNQNFQPHKYRGKLPIIFITSNHLPDFQLGNLKLNGSIKTFGRTDLWDNEELFNSLLGIQRNQEIEDTRQLNQTVSLEPKASSLEFCAPLLDLLQKHLFSAMPDRLFLKRIDANFDIENKTFYLVLHCDHRFDEMGLHKLQSMHEKGERKGDFRRCLSQLKACLTPEQEPILFQNLTEKPESLEIPQGIGIFEIEGLDPNGTFLTLSNAMKNITIGR